jgi:hypothetical protein
MKARRLIESSCYNSEQLKAVGKAFDDAWEQIAPEVSTRPAAIEAARMKLAQIVLSLAKNGTVDPHELRYQGQRRYALDLHRPYRSATAISSAIPIPMASSPPFAP